MPRKKSGDGFSPHEHYVKNKERIKAERAARYAEDPMYREEIKRKSKERYALVQQSNGVSRIDGMTYMIDGVQYYTTGYIASQVPCQTSLVNYYHTRGSLPSPVKVRDYTNKLYPIILAQAYIRVLQECIISKELKPDGIRVRLIELLGKDVLRQLTISDIGANNVKSSK